MQILEDDLRISPWLLSRRDLVIEVDRKRWSAFNQDDQ